MTRPPDRELLLPLDREEKYDYDRIQNIVAALEYLRTEAVNTGFCCHPYGLLVRTIMHHATDQARHLTQTISLPGTSAK